MKCIGLWSCSGRSALWASPAFVRACAAAAGDEIPQAAYDSFSMDDALSAARVLASQAREEQAEEPVQKEPDPDAGKHAFEVFFGLYRLG